jgi:Protein of unknown function (DUF3833)
MRFIATAFLALALAAPAEAAPKLDMVAFFSGRTEADNILRVVFKPATSLNVECVGRVEGKQFVMIETVHEGTKPARQRKWVIQEVGPGHYSGSMTEAVGPVDVSVSGDTAQVKYVMKGGLDVAQTLVLQADGRTLLNHIAVRKFGMRFGRVDGKVHKLD